MSFRENSFQFHKHLDESPNTTESEIVAEAYKQIKEIENYEAKKCNFKIDARELHYGSQINLQTENGETIDLSSYLDKKCPFVRGEEYFYHAYKNIKEPELISYHPINNQSAYLVSLLHEIGHANAWHAGEENIEPPLMDKIFAGLESLLDQVKIISSNKKEDEAKNNISANEIYQNKKQELVSRSERNAWAAALWILRDLKKQGVSVLDGFDNDFSKLKKYIDNILLT